MTQVIKPLETIILTIYYLFRPFCSAAVIWKSKARKLSFWHDLALWVFSNHLKIRLQEELFVHLRVFLVVGLYCCLLHLSCRRINSLWAGHHWNRNLCCSRQCCRKPTWKKAFLMLRRIAIHCSGSHFGSTLRQNMLEAFYVHIFFIP